MCWPVWRGIRAWEDRRRHADGCRHGIKAGPSARALTWPSDSDDSTSSYESYPGKGIVGTEAAECFYVAIALVWHRGRRGSKR